ncbi:hypothetical protein BDY21DRAFT_339893 [Lineolata rhizophorae]|uniref:Uncharacterized protein n=1 Tax=Lineolata rhizophorae TaxID=578093 RepID=A0A6A6P6U1_9PEZI|nr:hypothetical protein BDY21DRAFT_339893 [Lineolata rhizophorae]
MKWPFDWRAPSAPHAPFPSLARSAERKFPQRSNPSSLESGPSRPAPKPSIVCSIGVKSNSTHPHCIGQADRGQNNPPPPPTRT